MLRRRLTFPAAGIALVLSLVLTGLGIWAGNVIVSIMSDQLIEQMTEAVRREVDGMITFGDGCQPGWSMTSFGMIFLLAIQLRLGVNSMAW